MHACGPSSPRQNQTTILFCSFDMPILVQYGGHQDCNLLRSISHFKDNWNHYNKSPNNLDIGHQAMAWQAECAKCHFQGRRPLWPIPLKNSKSQQGLVVLGQDGGHVSHLRTEDGMSIPRGGVEIQALKVQLGGIAVFAPESSARPLVPVPLKNSKCS